jgi:hypothetical protein
MPGSSPEEGKARISVRLHPYICIVFLPTKQVIPKAASIRAGTHDFGYFTLIEDFDIFEAEKIDSARGPLPASDARSGFPG